jgi:hypothetical protein
MVEEVIASMTRSTYDRGSLSAHQFGVTCDATASSAYCQTIPINLGVPTISTSRGREIILCHCLIHRDA